jgi:predicted RNase H-like HicB family nuclease
MKRRKYTIVLKPGHEWKYTAQCLEIPQARSEGNTKKEALRNVKEAVELVLEHVESKAKRAKKAELVEVSI